MDWFFDHPEPLTPVGLMPMGGPDGAADVFGRFASNEPWLPTDDADGKMDDLDLLLAEFNDGPSNPGDVEITGPGDTSWSNPPLDGSGNGGDGGPVTGGGGNGEPPPPPPPPCGGEAPDGPTPAGVGIQALRDFVRGVASQIAALNDDWEWGAVIYMMNGQLFSTPPVTQEDPNNVSIGFSGVPTGAHVVAWVHSHTFEYGDPSQDRMSQDDADARDGLLGLSGGRFTVDSALMTYVIDNGRDELHEFGVDDNNRERGQNVTPCGGL